MKTFGLSNIQVGLVSAIPYAVAIATMGLWASYSDRSGDRLTHVAMAAGLCCLGMAVAAFFTGHPVGTIVCLSVAIAGVMAAWLLFWTLPTEFLSGRKAAAGIAAINSIGNLGGFFGPTIDERHAAGQRPGVDADTGGEVGDDLPLGSHVAGVGDRGAQPLQAPVGSSSVPSFSA